jgi:hypothetical protein
MKIQKHNKNRRQEMLEDKALSLLEKASKKLAESASETVELYEKYLLDQVTWRDLAKNMTKLRASISAYYAAGGK